MSSYIPVRDVMTPNPTVIDGLATVAQAVELMREKRFSSLVVGKRNDHDEFGLLTVLDIANQIVAKGRAPERVNVYEIMMKPALTVEASMQIKYAVRLMLRFGLTRALVLEEGRAAGIVTLRDLTLRSIGMVENAKGDA